MTLVAFGKLVGYNLKVAEELEKEGISCEVHAHSNLSIVRRTFEHIDPIPALSMTKCLLQDVKHV